ncbi:MAG: hypothetical protein A2176_01710 [Spirochaetes bacterium RBG_13_51_14]|nr:MAG: hypothetical protein A2176_01710 [Spirochaetes bacterium RBG_13_51_14]
MPREELEKKYAPLPSKFVEIDGTRVHYRDEGRGPALVLLHGVFSSLHTWDGWIKQLSGKYRFIRLDLPGWGLTGKADFEYNMEQYMNFLRDFFMRLGLKEVYLAGNSFGGQLAWNYAVRHPGQVRKLILIDALGYPLKDPIAIKLYTTPVIGYFTARITPKFIVAMNVREVYGDPDKAAQDAVDRYYEMMFYPGNRKQTKEIFLFLIKEFSTGYHNIIKVAVPTLIMWGAKDSWVPLELGNRFKSDIKNARLIVYKDAGHIPMEELPVETTRDADLFLKAN